MATKEELISKLAKELAVDFSAKCDGSEGPDLDCDIDAIEDNAVLAAQATFDAVIAQALLLQNQKLPTEQLSESFGIAPDEALPDNDPRRPLQRGVTYLTNNLVRVDYPRYRRLGLPVTSTLMESLVKEFNLRVKGTEKFWNDPSGAEAILTVRASLLSEDDRFNQFFATRPGCRYHRRSTLKKKQKMQAEEKKAVAI